MTAKELGRSPGFYSNESLALDTNESDGLLLVRILCI